MRRAPYSSSARSTLFWKYVLIIFIVVSLTILYLWEQIQVIEFDSTIRQITGEVRRAEEENDRLLALVCSLSQGHEIIQRAENELDMIYPEEGSTVVIVKARYDRPRASRNGRIYRTVSFVNPHGRRESTF